MKNQTWCTFTARHCAPAGTRHYVHLSDICNALHSDYKGKRTWDTPGDGKYTWIKGVKGFEGRNRDLVYGVKESDGYFHYEVRYDKGPKDKEWMEDGDWEYIQGLMRDGTLLEKEPNADKEIAPDHKYRAEITRALNEARATKEAVGQEARARTETKEIRRLADAMVIVAKEVEALDTDSQHYAIEAERHAYLADPRAKTQADIDASQKVEEQSRRASAATREVMKLSRIITDAFVEIKKQVSIATDALQQAETQRHANPTAVAEVKRFADIATAATQEAKKHFAAATTALVSAKANAATVIEAYKEAEKGDISLQKEIEKREECETRVAMLSVLQPPTAASTESAVSPAAASFWHARCDSKSHSDTISFIGIKRESRVEANKDLEKHEHDAHNGRYTPSGRVSPTL